MDVLSTEQPPGAGRADFVRQGAAYAGRNWPMVIGCAVLASFTVGALLAPFLGLPNPNLVRPGQALLPIFSPGHLLGTDQFGRDLLSRLIWGARISLPLGVGATLCSLLIGAGVGMTAGYFGGWLEALLMRIIDAVVGFPMILLAIIIVSMLGPSATNAVLAIVIAGIPFYARMNRGLVLQLRHRHFVQASLGMGLSQRNIIRLHILPHLVRPQIVYGTLDVGYKILAMASLSFLGLGTQPPTADWGNLLAEGRDVLAQAPQVATVPGIAIALTVMSFNLIGDWLQDHFDPQYQSSLPIDKGD